MMMRLKSADDVDSKSHTDLEPPSSFSALLPLRLYRLFLR
jgi:hypothetical protein